MKSHYSMPLLVILILLTLSCSPKKGRIDAKSNAKIIDIAAKVGKEKIVNLSEIASEVRYVPLETKKESLIDGGIISLFYVKEHIYVIDNISIIIFDSNGKHLSTVNRYGRGPQEYTDIINASVIPKNGNITIFSSPGILTEYDIYGNFIAQIKKPDLKEYDFINCIKLNHNTFLASVSHSFLEVGKYSVIVFDSLSNINLTITNPAYPFDKNYDGILRGNSELRVLKIPDLICFDNKIRIIHRDIDMDTIYSLTTNMKLEKPYIFNYGKYKMPYIKSNYKQTVTSKTSKKITLSGNIIETENYLFLKFNFRGIKTESYERRRNIVCGIFNKRDGELTLMKEPLKGKLGFKNDIDSGPAFWPSSQSSDNNLITYYAVDKFKQFADSNAQSSKIKEIATRLNENDNPVVVIVKIN
jgi:hypothetical protein